jgi:hypothetical protein
MASPLEFVNSLEIAIPDKFVGASSGDKTSKAKPPGKDNVDGGSLVSFVSDVSPQARSDALNSTLLAQLAATYKFNRFTQTEDWYNFYTKVLGGVGWVLQSFDFEQYSASGSTLKISDAIVDIATRTLSGPEVESIQTCIEALKSSDNTPWYDIFAKHSSGPSGNGNMQIGPCAQDSSGQLVMGLGCFYFSGVSTDERFFWIEYNSSTVHLFKAVQKSTLDNDVYKQVREAVIKKLGDNAKSMIHSLDIKVQTKRR